MFVQPARAAGWNVVFEDNFDGPELDRSAWATRFIYSNETLDHLNDELENYRDNQNHILDHGVLNLVARRVGDRFESGMIRSNQTFYFGYFEARVKLPKGRGIWPAFWLNPDYDINGGLNWPPEVDIFEYAVNGKDDTDAMFHSAGTVFPKGANIKYTYLDPHYNPRLRSYIGDQPLNLDWHVFGLLWRPDDYTVFLDGRKIYSREHRWVKKDGSLGGPAHIILNFAVGGRWAGRYGIDEDKFPQALSIDYVRVCQYSTAPDAGKSCGGSLYTPDPADSAYESPYGDLKKPILRGARISAVSGPPQKASDIPVVSAGNIVHVEAVVENMTAVPSSRSQLLGLRAIGATNIAAYSLSEIPAKAYATDTGQQWIADLKIPTAIGNGTYELVYGLAVPGPAALKNWERPNMTPITCAAAANKRAKAQMCIVDHLIVSRK